MKDQDEIIVFGVDVGKESVWAKVDSFPDDICNQINPYVVNKPQKIMYNANKSYKCDSDINVLVKQIIECLEDNKKIAIGFEAPMWTYYDTVTPRFKEEKPSHLWYTSAGAASHVMAKIFGLQIFNKLSSEYPNFKVTTNINNWVNGTIFLYEGFFAGSYKVARQINYKNTAKIGVTKSQLHYWDAFSVATAFWYYITNNQNMTLKSLVLTDLNSSYTKDSLWYKTSTEAKININDSSNDVYSNCITLTLQ
ncbi:hypothetical protein ACE3MZ_16080 [Paenibacillus sp. WLX1005]|uniref:hypothetical protein n=1 Tax=Paenibacillus sp. WLX1005 TaxID=3243766 RepID=UPI0039845640